MRYMIFGLFVSFSAVFLAGCLDVLSPPETAAGGAHALVVQIAGESPAGRTALPTIPGIASYTISVTRPPDTNLGGGAGLTGSGSFEILLNAVPAAGDIVRVEGLNGGGEKIAEGAYTLPSGYNGEAVTITLYFPQTGTGKVDLAVSFPGDFPEEDGGEITAAEVSLYQGLTAYPGNVYRFTRYLKDNDNGAAEDLGASIPLNYPNLPSGNYVVQIDFFRFKYVRVSRLIQTIIVRDDLTTDRWDNGGSTLTWGTDKFASSNANLAGIAIGGTSVPSFNSTTYAYTKSEAVTAAPGTKTLTVGSKPGQAIAVSLNGEDKGSGSSVSLPMKAANSIVIAVTAPDGVTKRTYAVSYTYYNQTEWYVDATGNIANTGTGPDDALTTVSGALLKITAAYLDAINSWPGKNTDPVQHNPVAARIHIIGTITDSVTISGSTVHPPIILTGTDPAEIRADALGPPLTINLEATVILEGDLTLTGGNTLLTAGGVKVESDGSFTMNGGTIKDNTTAKNGGGVQVTGTNSKFTMNNGTISGNTSTSTSSDNHGGGVYVDSGGAFTMNGGTIKHNTAKANGGGVYVTGANSSFIMNGGTIEHNAASDNDGGGVYVTSGGAFTMNGGTISENSALWGGGGVSAAYNGTFIMKGGNLYENTARKGGGVMLYTGSNTFRMEGGTISGNTARNDPNDFGGGGVCVIHGSFTMSGGTISENIVDDTDTSMPGGGGVVLYNNGSSFTMDGGTIIGNTVNNQGQGVYLNDGAFTMNGTARVDAGNTVHLASGKVITLSGILTANPAANIVPSGGSGTPVLGNDTATPENDITVGDNYKKFWLNGVSNAAGDIINAAGAIP